MNDCFLAFCFIARHGIGTLRHKQPKLRKATLPGTAKYISGILWEYNGRGESVLRVTKDSAAVNVHRIAHAINLAVRKVLALRAFKAPGSRLKAKAHNCPTHWNSTWDTVSQGIRATSSGSSRHHG
ncbi:unnamed protein product [Arctogadus glacialis]